MGKPADFMMGVQDFFAVLLPGAIASLLLEQYLPAEKAAFLQLSGAGEDRAVRWAAFLLSSYILGHFVFMLGAKLDVLYDRWREATKPSNRDRVYKAADDLRKRVTISLTDRRFTTLKWANAYIQIHSPQSRIELDRLEANSKFFRSLVIIAIALSIHFLLHMEANPFWFAAASVLLGALSWRRFRSQRWKMTELCYATAVIVHDTKANAENGAGESEAPEPQLEAED